MVMSMTMVMLILGAMLMTTTVATGSAVESNFVQRYAYRALEAGENAYANVVNANPNAINCSSVSDPNNPTCKGVIYNTWISVPNITTTNGAAAESYLFGNPQPQINPSTGVLTSVQVQVVGVAGPKGHYIYNSSIANLQPENGFLNNIWWSNFEAFDASTTVGSGNYANCQYDWQNSYNGPGGSCLATPVPFAVHDRLTGPVYSNDSIYVDGTSSAKPSFGTSSPYSPVTTADTGCQFVSLPGSNDDSPTACQNAARDYVAHYDPVNSSFGQPIDPPPASDQKLAAVAAAGGCLYSGPTTITMNGATMMITRPDTPATSGLDTENNSGNTNKCYMNGTTATAIPSNGVIFVQTATTAQTKTNANPFDDSVSGDSKYNAQTLTSGCTGCYYGQSNTPDSEADVFVQGQLSGQLTIGSLNNIIIDGNVTYQDCTSWLGTAQQSPCKYSSGTNDSLGLIAYNYVEVDHPQVRNKYGQLLGNLLPVCGIADGFGVKLPPPLCDPAGPGINLTIDASILALNQSFVVNNFALGSPEGNLYVYGAIAQFARGPVGTYNSGGLVSGYTKGYTWDPRLALFSPPSYLQPGTPAWGLGPSSATLATFCPNLPSPWVYQTTPTYGNCPTPTQ